MNTYIDILLRLIERDNLALTLPTENALKDLIELECYSALMKIKRVLEDDQLSDCECFEQIEEILCIFEDSGILCQYRHDFG